MMEICVNNVTKNFGFKNVLDRLSFEVKTQEKIALVGENGCGKSIILKLITKQELPTSGYIFIKKDSKIGYLTQEPIKDLFSLTVKEILYKSFDELNKIKSKMDKYQEKMNYLTGEKQINGNNQEDMKMKNYTITVNGNVYDVTVEEKPAGFTPAQSASPAPAPAPPPGGRYCYSARQWNALRECCPPGALSVRRFSLQFVVPASREHLLDVTTPYR